MKKFCFIILLWLILSACSSRLDQPNTTQAPQAQADVINTHGQVENISRLDNFVKNVKKQKSDQVRIVQYTTEGDPIITDLAYDGSSILYKYDTTQDKFGSGKITTKNCKTIKKIDINTKTSYSLSCDQLIDVLTIHFDTEKQDYFGFSLAYGENKIDTKAQTLVKHFKNGTSTEVSDFNFQTESLNQIYQALILANYLGDKQFDSSCNKGTQYDLTVWINSGARQYNWNECDQSDDGKQMTQAVKQMIEITQETHAYRQIIGR